MSSHRIIVNTAATYIRSVITVGLGLLSARWVVGGLGATDYGLFAVVGSIIGFITLLSGVMAVSASRHFAFALGRGNPEEANKWFNTSLNIHVILPIVLIAFGWPIGEYCIRHVFTIPFDRIHACLWVFRLSLIVAFVGMVTIPYMAMFTAKQHIAEPAAWGVLQSLLSFIFAYLLTIVPGDRLFFYAGYGVAISVFFRVIQVMRARHIFQECRIHYYHWFDRSRFKEILSFACWNLIGSFGAILRDQGSVVLLNLHFGPKVNAAFGIANTVSAQAAQLGSSMLGAFSPELNASEGRGDRTSMLALAQRASKFGTILVLLFAIPLVVEMDYILKLWLREPPLYTALFCQLILVAFLVDRLTTGYMMAVNAKGVIAAYQATVGTCLALTIPLAWVFLKLGAQPTSVGLAFIIAMAGVSAGRVLWARRLLGVPIWHWLRDVLLPVSTVTLAAASATLLPRCLLSPSFSRLVLVTVASVTTATVTAWLFAMNATERSAVKQSAMHMIARIGPRSNA